MQAARPNSFAPITCAEEDDHAPLITDDRGPLPAFDQLANGQTTGAYRANRVPRLPAARVGMCRRLHNRVKAHYLAWQLRSMRARMDRLQARMHEATEIAIGLALLHRHSPALQVQRRAWRFEHDTVFEEWKRVRAELDALESTL
jgi:hypothetical protein